MIEILCVGAGVFIGYVLLNSDRRTRFVASCVNMVNSVKDQPKKAE
jgi:hypothetical protein